MVTTAFVHIWEKRAGALRWDASSQTASFAYDADFRASGWDLSPIVMPLSNDTIYRFPELARSATFKGVPGLLADLLPDRYGNTLINTWLSKNGRPTESLNPVETLCFIGQRGMGALEIEPASPKGERQAETLEVSTLVETANSILSGRKDFSSALDPDEEKRVIDILKIGTSAGGARSKAIIAFNPKTQEVKSGQVSAPKGFEHWMIKFDGVTDVELGSSWGYGRVEMAYYLMATAAGIDMMPCRLFEENGRAHFMTKRFDRKANGDKVHFQSFCGIRHFDYNYVGQFSYEQLFETMRMLRLTYPEAEQMFRRMAFNVMTRNCDDHSKNFAFIMEKDGRWKLSPAFDICHAYRPNSPWVSQHSMSIRGKRQGISRADLLAVGKAMNIKKAKEIIDQVQQSAAQWPRFAKEVQVEPQLANAIQATHLLL